MSAATVERIGVEHRLRTSLEYGFVKREGRVFRGRHGLVIVAARPGTPTKVGFVASRRGVGNAIRRNRARRRLREIVRRRWSRVEPAGLWLMFVAFATATTAPHPELVADVERLLEQAGALRPGLA